jgi:predicted phage-related endonuclease
VTEEEVRDLGDEQREFIEQQASGIGATDSAKILGLSRWGTALTVYERKVNPPKEASQSSLPAWMGLKLQSVVGELYTSATGNRLRADNLHHRHPEHDWLVCHLDFRVLYRPELLMEAKTRAYEKGYGEDGSTIVPADVWVQCQHEMAVVNAKETHLAVLFGHRRFAVYPILRDQPFIDKMIPRLEDFWVNNVLAGVPPEPSGHALDSDYVRRTNADHDESMKAATPEQEMLVRRLVVARQATNEAKVAQAEVENLIKQIIADAAGLQGSFGKITWKRTKDSIITDWPLVAQGLTTLLAPDRAEEADALVTLYTRTEPGTRRFLVDVREM